MENVLLNLPEIFLLFIFTAILFGECIIGYVRVMRVKFMLKKLVEKPHKRQLHSHL